MNSFNISAEKITARIKSCGDEMVMSYFNQDVVNVTEGNIVVYNAGVHLAGEVNGARLFGIVCKVSKRDWNRDMVLIVPMYKLYKLEEECTGVIVREGQNACYYDAYHHESVAIAKKANFVSSVRIKKVIGKVDSFLFVQLIQQISDAFNFTACFGEKEEELTDESSDEILKGSFNEAEAKESEVEEEIPEADAEGMMASEAVAEVQKNETLEKTAVKKPSLLDIMKDETANAITKVQGLEATAGIRSKAETYLSVAGFDDEDMELFTDILELSIGKEHEIANMIVQYLQRGYPEKYADTKFHVLKKMVTEKFSKNAKKCFPKTYETYPRLSFMFLVKLFNSITD